MLAVFATYDPSEAALTVLSEWLMKTFTQHSFVIICLCDWLGIPPEVAGPSAALTHAGYPHDGCPKRITKG